ncbi:uncharacterized protein PG998_007832 [Apiospora kogelbergensis]|uniref:uncharacterized protein n=1 Tax=Apiospora kogelbergensis TaxID=1337665 RepID=UPI00312F44C1
MLGSPQAPFQCTLVPPESMDPLLRRHHLPYYASGSTIAQSPLRRSTVAPKDERPRGGMTNHSRKVTPTGIVVPKSPAATAAHTSRTAIPTLYSSQTNNENIPPNGSKESLKTKYRPFGSLPKSRTLDVFSNLTASLSRGSLPSFSRTVSSSSGASVNEEAIHRPRTASTTSTQEVEVVHPMQVTNAQPCEYWTGRFMALQDRLHSELLLPENLTTLITAHAGRSQPTPAPVALQNTAMPISSSIPNLSYLRKTGHKHTSSTSSTASNRTSTELDATLLMDEDNRARRVFLHLEALCITNEAKKSLHTWQYNYARRMGKECLLPKGESNKGWVGRLLGKHDHGSKRGNMIGVV